MIARFEINLFILTARCWGVVPGVHENRAMLYQSYHHVVCSLKLDLAFHIF